MNWRQTVRPWERGLFGMFGVLGPSWFIATISPVSQGVEGYLQPRPVNMVDLRREPRKHAVFRASQPEISPVSRVV